MPAKRTMRGGRPPASVAALTQGLPVRKRRPDSFIVEDHAGHTVGEVLLNKRAGMRVNLKRALPRGVPAEVARVVHPTRGPLQWAAFTYVFDAKTRRAAKRALELAVDAADQALTRDADAAAPRRRRRRRHANVAA